MSGQERLASFHENYLSAKTAVESAETSAFKKVQLVPFFRRLFPVGNFNEFQQNRQTQQSILESKFCKKACQDKKDCLDECNNYYKNALADGHEFIRKVHKDYKNATLEEEAE